MTLFLKNLKNNGYLDNVHMTVCIVGSRKIDSADDYGSRSWQMFAPNLNVYGFDADADACDEANADLENRNINWKEVHIPLALGKAEEERTLYVTKSPMCSSLFLPNENYLGRFEELSEYAGLDFSFEIDTTTLDSFCQSENISEIDFLQIDVQGADLDVLRGASNLLNTVLAVQIEVEFSHLYIDQPLFADVDIHLRDNDFTLFDLRLKHCLRNKSPLASKKRAGQVLWGEADYLRDLISEDTKEENKKPERILKLACIADIQHFPDYALEILIYLTTNHGDNPSYNFADTIVQSLAELTDLEKQGLATLEILEPIKNYMSQSCKNLYGF